MRNKRTYAVIGGILGLSSGLVLAVVPAPSELPAKMIVSGRTSTQVDIKTVKVGQEIPKTYAGDKIHNTPGFEFYVSKHYALKSDMGDDFSREILEVSELALPHWEDLIGEQPPDPDTRMYICYGKDFADMNRGMVSDVGFAGGNGGGITIYANHSAYNYPSGTLMYHRRALIIHENLHLLNMICKNSGGYEGETYSGEQHVYDPVKKQLTVLCFDKAPVNNWTDHDLQGIKTNFPSLREAARQWWDGGGEGVLYYQFMMTDPDRYLKWQIWRDELCEDRIKADTNPAIMEDIYGSLDALNPVWERWVKARRASFHHVDWGWEQDGNALMAYGWPWKTNYWSQMDIQYVPNETAQYDPLRMDYPMDPMPSIVGPVKRGVAEPSVGYVADLTGGGWVGMGLGVTNRSMCQVIVMDGKLVVEGKEMSLARREFPLTDAVKTAGKQDGNRYGVTIQIKPRALAIVVRADAGRPGAMQSMTVSVPIDDALHQRFMTHYLSLIAKDGRPRITPFFDDARRLEPDLTKPAPPNRWRFAAMDQLETLYRAAWRLKDKTPASLLSLKATMLAAVDKDPATQSAALTLYNSTIARVAQDVLRGSDPVAANTAVADLMRVSMRVNVDGEAAADQAALTVEIRSKGESNVKGRIVLTAEPEGSLGTLPAGQTVDVAGGQTQKLSWKWNVPAGGQATAAIRVKATLACGGTAMGLTDTAWVRPSIPCWWVLGPFDNRGDGTVDTPQIVEREKVHLGKTYVGMGGRELHWQKSERSSEAKLTDEHVVDFLKLCGSDQNVSAYALTWVVSPKERDALLGIGSDDGVVVWLNGQRVHAALANRGYRSMQDRVPIHLKAGRNELLVRVTQTFAGWVMGARLVGRDEKPLPDVSCTLVEP